VGERGKNEMDVECKSDGEGSDVTHPRSSRFAREERERIGGENEREALTGCEGVEVVLEVVSAQERVEGVEVSEEVGLEDGTREKGMCLVTRGKWAMGATTVCVWEVGVGGRVVVVGGERAALTTETEEGRGAGEGG